MTGRDGLLAEIRKRLVGPGIGVPGDSGTHEDEIIESRLSLAYMMGMLFPRAEKAGNDLLGDEADNDTEVDVEDPLSMATAMLPSSMGLSVCVVSGSKVRIRASAAIYKKVPAASAEKREGANQERKK